MAMGDYDEDEHERRERKNGSIDLATDDDRTHYEGKLSYDSGDSAEELLAKFNEIKAD